MSPPLWAYYVDNFCTPPDEELICCICSNVLRDPKQAPCQHVFCKVCIDEWLRGHSNCPICRSSVTKSQIIDTALPFKNLISKMMVRCFNFEKGCNAKMSIESAEYHIKECLYEFVRCKNYPCEFRNDRIRVNIHETSECMYQQQICNKCNFTYVANTAHDCLDALKKELQNKDRILQEHLAELQRYRERYGSLNSSEQRPSSNTPNQAQVSNHHHINSTPLHPPSTNPTWNQTSPASRINRNPPIISIPAQSTSRPSQRRSSFRQRLTDHINSRRQVPYQQRIRSTDVFVPPPMNLVQSSPAPITSTQPHFLDHPNNQNPPIYSNNSNQPGNSSQLSNPTNFQNFSTFNSFNVIDNLGQLAHTSFQMSDLHSNPTTSTNFSSNNQSFLNQGTSNNPTNQCIFASNNRIIVEENQIPADNNQTNNPDAESDEVNFIELLS